jgi:putative DNA methylase
MPDPTPPRKPVFIEKIFPVTLLNQQVYYEHGGNPFKGLHRWYSRKPLSFSRASVLGSLLPADLTLEEFEYLLGMDPDGKTKLYKTPPGSVRIQKVHDLCEQMWGTRTPTVMDAFAGGGSIPFEAVRYGLRVLASDLNPVAVVTMKAAMEYPLKFGAELQGDIDYWVKWVGDEAAKRLDPFFPSLPGETVQNYLWAHTVVCPSCESVVPLSPNWWLYKRPEKQNLHKWCAVKPIPNLAEKRVDFELVKGRKGKGSTIVTETGEDYDPDTTTTISRGVGKCPNCDSVIENDLVMEAGKTGKITDTLYTVAIKIGRNSIEFRLPLSSDLEAIELSKQKVNQLLFSSQFIPNEDVPPVTRDSRLRLYGMDYWHQIFNSRQLLTLVTYLEIINEVKQKIETEMDPDRAAGILTYLAMVMDRCVDKNSRLSHLNASKGSVEGALGQHSLNLFWNYPEISGKGFLWSFCADALTSDYESLCTLVGNQKLVLDIEENHQNSIQVNSSSADSLFHIPDKSVDTIVTDPPYYATIQYAELSDFFYVWQKRILGDIFPDLYATELTDKDREAVANPSRFRNMGISPEILANQDYEAKMENAFREHYRVLRDDGVMTVQFNHKDSGAWDVLAKSLIDAGFEITASWAVSTENPQNLHQAQKNSVSSTVLLVCRKRDPEAPQAWWDDIRPELYNAVEQRAPDYEANDITGIDLYLSAFGPALNIFSRSWPVLDSAGQAMRPEVAFIEARKAIAAYRFRKLAQTDTAGFDPLTQWYFLAWDAFRAREFPYDEARQLALAVGGFNVSDLAKTHKLLDSTSGTCKLLTPQQRLKKRAFAITDQDFSLRYLIDGIHAIIALYQEEQTIDPVRRFMRATGLVSNDTFMRALEVALKVIPRIGDAKKRIPEEQALADLWLAMDEIQAKVLYEQQQIDLEGQGSLDLDPS